MPRKLALLDLFSGIGGFSLGLERSGFFRTVAFCEIEPFPRRVLKKHWPDIPIYEDVRKLTADALQRDGIAVDAICGGFPCQDISVAGKGAGIEGERSGLWTEYARIIGELRPRVVIVENVAALIGRGLDRVLGDLASLGFDAGWHCIAASAVGAPHRRDRLWIIANANNSGSRTSIGGDNLEWSQEDKGQRNPLSKPCRYCQIFHDLGRECTAVPFGECDCPKCQGFCECEEDVARAECRRLQGVDEQRSWSATIFFAKISRHCRGGEFWETWRFEPDVGRMAYGIPSQMDRLKGLGNAVVPQIPELIGRAIGAAMSERSQ